MFLGQWSEEDRGYAIALHRVEADMHHACGLPWSVTMNPENAERFTVDDLGICPACNVLAAKMDEPKPRPMMRVRLRD